VGLIICLGAVIVRRSAVLMRGCGMRLCVPIVAVGVVLRRLAVVLGCGLVVACGGMVRGAGFSAFSAGFYVLFVCSASVCYKYVFSFNMRVDQSDLLPSAASLHSCKGIKHILCAGVI